MKLYKLEMFHHSNKNQIMNLFRNSVYVSLLLFTKNNEFLIAFSKY